MAALLVGITAFVRRVNWCSAFLQWPAITIAGLLYALGNWAFFIGVSQGWVSVVAVLAALSPLPTIILARLILCESLTRWQLSGIAVALAGVALITLGASA
jgi:drug/metabolite transporter (DMT)-like permease